jgi:hypothetical protein
MPFYIGIYIPPLIDKVSIILTPKKKDQSADSLTQDICKFSLTPQNNQEHQSMPTSLTALKRLWGHPSEEFIQRGRGGGVWTLNGMAHLR